MVQRISQTSPLPNIETPEDSWNQSNAQGRPASAPRSGTAALSGLASLRGSKGQGPTVPSGTRKFRSGATPQGDMACDAGLAPSVHTQAISHAVSAPALADIGAVRQVADSFGEMEARLAKLKQPADPQAEGANPASEEEIHKTIQLLEEKHKNTSDKVADLRAQCAAAFEDMAKYGIALQRKIDRLDQLHEQLAISATATVPQLKSGVTAALPTEPDRMAALERQIRSLEGSRKAVAEEALTAVHRDELRRLGTCSMPQTSAYIVMAYCRKQLLGRGGPLLPELENSIDKWLDSWLPAPHVSRRGRVEPFQKAVEHTFRHIEEAASPEASANDALTALAAFLHLMSLLDVPSFGVETRQRIVRDFAVYLIAINLEHQFPFPLLQRLTGGESLSKAGFTLADKMEEQFSKALKHLTHEFVHGGSNRLWLNGEKYQGTRLIQAQKQLNALATHCDSHRDAFITMLMAAEKNSPWI